MKKLATLLIALFSAFLITLQAQNPEWLIYTMGNTMTCFEDDGTYLWIGSEGGLIRRNKMDNSMIRYNRVNSGMPDNWVKDLAIDSYGNKWIATNTGGLVKFDGTVWTVYNTHNSGIVEDRLHAVAIDSSGRIWIGSETMGISVFDGTSWITYDKTNSGLHQDYIHEITFDQFNTAWIGAGNHGLYKFDGNNWTNYTYGQNSLPGWSVSCVMIDQNNIKWIGTEGGLSVFDDVTFTNYTNFNSGICWKEVTCIEFANDGITWIGTTAGLNKFDGTTFTCYYDELGTQFNEITALEVEGNNLLFSVAREGILKYDGNSTFTILPFPFDGPVKNIVLDIAFDAQGNPWFGSSSALMHFDGVQWTNYTSDNSGIPESRIEEIAIDNNGVVWMGTFDEGVSRLSGGRVTNYTMADSRLPSNCIRSLEIDHDNNVWVGTGDGNICMFDGVSWTIFEPSTTGLQENNEIWAIAVDENNNKWFGSYYQYGLIKYDGVNWTHVTDGSGFNHMKFDEDGTLWCTTGDYLKKYYDGTLTPVAPEGNPTGGKLYFDFDPNGSIWLAAWLSGAVKLENDVWTTYNFSNSPIASHYTVCTAIDPKGNKWIGADAVEDGISVYNENGVMVNTKEVPSAQLQSVSVFPNPATNYFFIPESIEKNINRVRIINMLGSEVYEGSYNNTQEGINITGLTSGIYIVRMIGEDCEYTGKILIN